MKDSDNTLYTKKNPEFSTLLFSMSILVKLQYGENLLRQPWQRSVL